MNIVADQLSSKPNTQAMLSCYLMDMKEYFKKSANFSEDKTYARILKIAETTQKFLTHFNCISNISLKLIGNLKLKVDDKFQNPSQQTQSSSPTNPNPSPSKSSPQSPALQDLDPPAHLLIKLSRQNDAAKTAALSLGRDINQEFMRKLVYDALDDLKDDIEEVEGMVEHEISQELNLGSDVLFFDSYLSNKKVVAKVAQMKKIKITYIKTSGADPKNNQINLTDVASKIRKFQKVIISAESVLKNGAIIAEPGSLMVALAAKKYNIPIVAISRGYCLTQKVMIDQYSLLAQNPMKYFPKSQSNLLKAHIAKKSDLIDSKFLSQIITELGSISPANIQLHFSEYYDYN